MAEVNVAPAAAPAPAPAPAAAAPPSSSSSSSSWPKRLHKKVLKGLTKSSATNCDMAIFRALFYDGDGPAEGADDEGKEDSIAVLRALAPLRYSTLALPWQRRLARRVIEHKKVGAPGVVNFVVARQRWFDKCVRGAAAAGVDQVVALAAGYELRAHRGAATAAGAKIKFFEVDLPHASAKKQALVTKLGGRYLSTGNSVRYVAADLSVPGQLLQKLEAASFERGKPVLFTCEGLLYYLPPPAAAALVREAGDIISVSSSPASALALDYLHADALAAGWAGGIEGGGGGDGGGAAKKTTKKKKNNKSISAPLVPNKMPRAYEVTARSVAAKGEPFRSGFGASALDAAAWVAASSGGALSLRAHTTTLAAAGELLGPGTVEEHGVLGFYSFLVAEASGPLPPSAAGGAAGAAVAAAADAVARVGGV